jgi:hypothetical protein
MATGSDSSVHHHDIQPAEFLGALAQHQWNPLVIQYIQAPDADLGSLGLQFLPQGFQVSRVTRCEGQLVAALGEMPGHARAEASGGSGDQYRFCHLSSMDTDVQCGN